MKQRILGLLAAASLVAPAAAQAAFTYTFELGEGTFNDTTYAAATFSFELPDLLAPTASATLDPPVTVNGVQFSFYRACAVTDPADGPAYETLLCLGADFTGGIFSQPTGAVLALYFALTGNTAPLDVGTYAATGSRWGVTTAGQVAEGFAFAPATVTIARTVTPGPAVPEPATLALLGLGLGACGLFAARRRARAPA